MKKKKWNKILAVLLVMVTAISLLSGCGSRSAEKEDAETITVYRKDHMNNYTERKTADNMPER